MVIAKRAVVRIPNFGITATTIILIVVIYWLPNLCFLGSILIFSLALMKKNSTLYFALALSSLLVLYGASGEVLYFGSTAVSDAATSKAILFLMSLALGLHFGDSLPVSRLGHSQRNGAERIWFIVAFSSVAILCFRLSSGIPLLEGDSSRLAGVIATSPILGLLSGAFPIATAFLKSPSSKAAIVLKLIVSILVIGTASRLLAMAVLLGFFSSIPSKGKRKKTIEHTFNAVAIAVAVVLVIVFIYSQRTDSAISEIMSSRVQSLTGLPLLATRMFGPSLFLASRNGLVFYDLMASGGFHPPGGFILGSLVNVTGIGSDPEVWLTSAVGLNPINNGSLATPLWSAANIDFGFFGAVLFAVVVGMLLALFAEKNPDLKLWIAFSVLISGYGLYLFSAQFISASLLIVFFKMLTTYSTKVQNS